MFSIILPNRRTVTRELLFLRSYAFLHTQPLLYRPYFLVRSCKGNFHFNILQCGKNSVIHHWCQQERYTPRSIFEALKLKLEEYESFLPKKVGRFIARLIRKCSVLNPDASEWPTVFRNARVWPFRVLQSCSKEICVLFYETGVKKIAKKNHPAVSVFYSPM